MNRTTLIQEIQRKKTFLCVGLDPEISKLPSHLPKNIEGLWQFLQEIIDATRDLCVAYKPNTAFFEALGPEGWVLLQKTMAYIGSQHLIIADAKRGDIGNTSRLYAQAFFTQMGADAITVAPYMGADSVQPFLEFQDKWVILLALTSNSGSADFQQTRQEDTGGPLFEKVLTTAQTWGSPDNLMFVVGATHPEAFTRIRALAPDHFLLVPGVGAQGGDLAAICRYGRNKDGGLLINAARSIIYASSDTDFAEKARAEAASLRDQMSIWIEG